MKKNRRSSRRPGKSAMVAAAPNGPVQGHPRTSGAALSRRSLLLNLRNGAIGLGVASTGGWGIAHAYQTHVERHDLSVIGNGIPSVVQIHDPHCPVCRALQREMLRAASDFDEGILQARVASIRTGEGKALADRYRVPHVTLLLFDGQGEMQRILSGPNERDALRDAFAAHVARP